MLRFCVVILVVILCRYFILLLCVVAYCCLCFICKMFFADCDYRRAEQTGWGATRPTEGSSKNGGGSNPSEEGRPGPPPLGGVAPPTSWISL